MSAARMRLVGTEADTARPRPAGPQNTTPLIRGYRVEDLSRAAMTMAFMAAPVVSADGRVSMREVSEAAGQLRLHDPIDPNEVIKLGDELFGSTITDLFFLDQNPNRDRVAFSYELADGRYGTAVATLCA